ncbi:MAG TPA: hypothetical protein VJY62_15620 [Bacteroidia bacterium]|nr:hypothetical protein [Bacteroidia bacterium]
MRKKTFILVLSLLIFNSVFAGYYHIGALNASLDISSLAKHEKLSVFIISFTGCPPCKQLEIVMDSIYHKTSLWDTNYVDIYEIDVRKDDNGNIYRGSDFKKTIIHSNKTININSFPNVFLFSFGRVFIERFEQGSTNLIDEIKQFIDDRNDCISSIREKNEDIDDLNKKLQNEKTVGNDLRKEIEMKRGIIVNLNKDINDKKTTNDSLSNMLKSKEEDIVNRNKDIDNKKITIDSLSNILKSNEITIVNFNIEAGKTKITNDSLSTILNKNKKKVEDYDNLSMELKTKTITSDSLKAALDIRIKRQKEAVELLSK